MIDQAKLNDLMNTVEAKVRAAPPWQVHPTLLKRYVEVTALRDQDQTAANMNAIEEALAVCQPEVVQLLIDTVRQQQRTIALYKQMMTE